MKITTEEKDQLTVVTFHSGTIRENLRLAAPFVLVLPAILLLWAWSSLEIPWAVWPIVGVVLLLIVVGYFCLWNFRQVIEIHPETIYVKRFPLFSRDVFPREDGMVLMIENHPVVQLGVPREMWVLSVGYRDGIYQLIEEINDHRTVMEIACFLCDKLGLPLADYTYVDQLQQVMFYTSEEAAMPFTQRVLRYPGLLVIGEIHPGEVIREDQYSSSRCSFTWTPFNLEFIGRSALLAGAGMLLIWFNVISSRPDALINLPITGGDRVLYYAIGLYYLGRMAYHSGIRYCLELNGREVLLTRCSMGVQRVVSRLKTSSICHVRMKPSPQGLVLLIVGREDTIQVQVGLSFKEDLKILLWLTERVQDFLLQNRPLAEAGYTPAMEKNEARYSPASNDGDDDDCDNKNGKDNGKEEEEKESTQNNEDSQDTTDTV